MKTLLALCRAAALAAAPRARAGPERRITVGFLLIGTNNVYFQSCRQGAERAAARLGVELLPDGPAEPDPAAQEAIVDRWIAQGVDAIAAACNSRSGLSPALRRARARGIRVVTYDADAEPDAREFFVNQATPESIGTALMDDAARLCGGRGEYALITADLSSANENGWRRYIEARNRSSYPAMRMVAVRPCQDNIEKGRVQTAELLRSYPNLKLVMAICSPGVPGAAQAVQQAGLAGRVKVIGLGLPNENRAYIRAGATDNVILWNTLDLGELTLRAAVALVKGELRPGARAFEAGPLGRFRISGGGEIVLGRPLVFDRGNIDRYDF